MGFLQYLCASSARTTIAAAEPSETPEQSMMPSGSAIFGELRIASIGTSLRNCALGFLAPFLWFFQAMGASNEKDAGAVIVFGVPSFGGTAPTRPEKPESLSFSTPIAMATS